jgi:hypothetical protein
MVGRFFGRTQDSLFRKFIELNNAIIERFPKKILPQELLLLIPHCIQNSQCSRQIVEDIKNCKMCGKCYVGKILQAFEKIELKIITVPGGALAREAIKAQKPKAIVAVACERELATGIRDVYPLPVYGILNERPNGPCKETVVDVGKLINVIHKFLDNNKDVQEKS